MFRLGIHFESTPPLAKFSKWSSKEVKDLNQSTSNARPAMHCRPKNKFAIPRKQAFIDKTHVFTLQAKEEYVLL